MTDPDNKAIDPSTWLRFAESSLSLARIGHQSDGPILEDLCFLLQQATEKAIKSLMIARSIEVPKTHALGVLIQLLVDDGVSPPDSVNDVVDITLYAARTRYPGGPPVTEEDYQAALKIAEHVVAWVRQQLRTTDDAS